MAPVSGIGENAVDAIADGLFHPGDDLRQGMPVIGVARQGLGVERELATLRVMQRGGHRDLDAELVGPVRLALADAFDLRGVETVNFPAPLVLALLEYPPG